MANLKVLQVCHAVVKLLFGWPPPALAVLVFAQVEAVEAAEADLRQELREKENVDPENQTESDPLN